MAKRIVAATVHGPPLTVEIQIPPPDATTLNELRQAITKPSTSNQQAMIIARFRVEEAIFGKAQAAVEAARKAIPLICAAQESYLLTGD